MTCIVGIQLKDKTIIGGDSQISSGNMCFQGKEKKIFNRGGFSFGITGNPRLANLVKYSSTPDSWDFNTFPSDIYTFMNTIFIEWIRNIFKEGGYSEVSNNEESVAGSVLVSCFGTLFVIDGYYSLIQYEDGIYAIGCGSDIAYGAMYALKDRHPKERLTIALEASAKYSTGVSAPFYFVESYKEKK